MLTLLNLELLRLFEYISPLCIMLDLFQIPELVNLHLKLWARFWLRYESNNVETQKKTKNKNKKAPDKVDDGRWC